MKLKNSALIFIAVFTLSMPLHAYEIWHTASGKAYNVFASMKVAKKGTTSTFHVMSYQTETNLNDRYGLVLEYYDLLTHLYYFHLPENVRDDANSVVTIEAFDRKPAAEGKTKPSRRYTKKLSEIKNIISKHKRTDVNRLQAFRHFNKKAYAPAIEAFRKISDKVPHDYVQTANAFLLSGDRDAAIKILGRGTQKFPEDVTVLNNLAMTTMLKGTFLLDQKLVYDPEQIKEAKKMLTKAMKIAPKHWLTAANIAVLEETAKNVESAEKNYLNAWEWSQKSPEMAYRVASFYHGHKNWDQAKMYYEQALSSLSGTRMPAAESRITEIKKRLNWVKNKKPLK